MASTVGPAALVVRRTAVLLRHLPAALEGDATALHRTRVASRRLRELLPLLESAPRRSRRRVRKLTRALGQVREVDVALGLLETDHALLASPGPARASVRRHLRKERQARREAMLDRLRDLNLKKFERRLAALVAVAEEEEPAGWRRILATRLSRRAARLRDAMEAAGSIYVPDRLHAVRIAAKQLRYALEIAADLRIAGAADLAASIRRSQTTLGALQDRTVLLRHVHAAAANTTDAGSRRGLLRMAAILEQAAREVHARYVAQRDELASAISAVRQRVIPELAASRRVPLKSTLTRAPAAGRGRRTARR